MNKSMEAAKYFVKKKELAGNKGSKNGYIGLFCLLI
jgi:hypothetical protein